jgi:hypothetical protein
LERAPNPGTPHDLIRVGITLAAVSIALAALQQGSPMVPWFLLAGLAATIGTGYAMAQLWGDSRLSAKDLIPRRRPDGLDLRYEAPVYITWGLIGLIGAFIALLLTTFY